MATVNLSDGILSVPQPPTGTVEEVAAWYAQHVETLKAVSSAKYTVEQRLRAYYRDHGPSPLPSAR